MIALLSSFALLGIALIVRIGPQLGRPPVGCDSWFYLGYAREVRRTRRFPVHLPGYLLDITEQWYPPLFPLLLALGSPRFLDRWHWLLAPVLDLAQMAVLLIFVWASSASIEAILISGLAYAIMPTLVHDTQALTSRPFGSLLSTLVLVSAIAMEGLFGIATAAFGFALVLLSHKLSTQLLAAMLPVLWLVTGNANFVAIVVIGVLLALGLSRGFYRKIFLGHLDVLRFWRRNHQFYTAHQFDDSPVYGRDRQPARHRYYARGIRGWLHLVGRLGFHQPFVIVLVPAWSLVVVGDPVAWWALCVAVAALVTTVIPGLRFLGEGHKYWKYAAVPLAYLCARVLVADGAWTMAMFGAAIIASLAAIAYVYRTPAADQAAQAAAQDEVARYILSSDLDRIVCLPLTFADKVTYATGRAVFWGTHSAGHSKVAGFYPVLTHTVSELTQDWRPGGLVVDRTYVDPARLGLALTPPIYEAGNYQVYRWPQGKDPSDSA